MLLFVPKLVNGAFSAELTIKAILTEQSISYDKEHNLKILFEKLPAEIQNQIWEYLVKKAPEYSDAEKREKELKQAEKQMKERLQTFQKEKYEEPVSKFRTLTKSMKFYEILDDVELIIHVKAEENVLNDIFEHRYEIKSIGRSEDFVSVEDAKIVELLEDADDEIESEYSAYLDFTLFREENPRIFIDKKYGAGGTRYRLNRNYTIVDGKRKFEKRNVLYVSGYTADRFGNGLYLDSEGGKNYIVNFL